MLQAWEVNTLRNRRQLWRIRCIQCINRSLIAHRNAEQPVHVAIIAATERETWRCFASWLHHYRFIKRRKGTVLMKRKFVKFFLYLQTCLCSHSEVRAEIVSLFVALKVFILPKSKTRSSPQELLKDSIFCSKSIPRELLKDSIFCASVLSPAHKSY